MAKTKKEVLPPIRWLSDTEGKELFDREAREHLGISGDEFLRRWDGGHYDEDPDRPEIVHLVMMIPLVR
jgi:hypothetical protein